MQLSKILIVSQYASLLAVAIAIGTRSQGSYVYMLILSVVGLVLSLRCFSPPGYESILAESRPVIVLLIGYVLSLFLSGFLKGGVEGLRDSFALYSSISLLFIAGISLPLWPPMPRFRCYLYVAMPLSISLVSSGLGYAISNAERPVSSLRPSEFVLAIGLAILSLTVKDFARLLTKLYSLRLNLGPASTTCLCGLFVAFFAVIVYLFRGVISSVILIAAFSLLLLDLRQTKSNKLIFAAILVGAPILLLALSPLIRFALFKILFSSFSAGEGFADRFHLLGESMKLAGEESGNVPLFGPLSSNVDDFWAHNTFVDLFVHDGIVPAILFSAFVLAYAALMLKKVYSVESIVRFGLVPAVLLLGSLLQPVQYSDGIAYALSFLGLGYSLGLALQNHKSPLLGTND